MMNNELEFCRVAIDEARKCKPEDARVHPLVGAVIVKDGKILAQSHRGEMEPGEHAEFTALEKKLPEAVLAGSTVYTTLEPCTSRNHPKIPCAERLIERKVSRVVIGMLDPNPVISGKGQQRLRDANITIDVFPRELMSEIEEINRAFIRYQRSQNEAIEPDEQFVAENQGRSLDEWYTRLNAVYWNRNYSIDASGIFTHLVEVVGGLSSVASSKTKPGVEPQSYVCKAIAWWLALCGKMGIRSVGDVLWDKFPGACPYCKSNPHNPITCSEQKAETIGPEWEALEALGRGKDMPDRLRAWQIMFADIYPVQQTEEYGPSFARLTEELGELAEAVRVFSSEPGYFLSEAADVFAWLMHIQNILEFKGGVKSTDRGVELEDRFCRMYPDSCRDCGKKLCSCPPILSSTIGRIAHEVPKSRGSYGSGGRFMTPDKVIRKFQLPG